MKGKKLIWPALFVLLLWGAWLVTGVGSQGGPAEASAVGTVKVEGMLNVRTGPGTNYKKVQSGGTEVMLTNGARVTITGVSGKWYHVKFKQNGKTVTGYVSGDYVTVRTGKTIAAAAGISLAKGVAVRKDASTAAEKLKAGTKAITLEENQEVVILSEKLEKNKKWYRISFSYKKKGYKGYVLSSQISLSCGKGLPGVSKTQKAVTLYTKAGGTAPVRVNGKNVAVKNGVQMTLLGQKNVSNKKYLNVKLTSNKKTVTGYMEDNYVFLQLVKEEKPAVTAAPSKAPAGSAVPSAAPKVTATPKATEDGEAEPKETEAGKTTATPKATEGGKATATPKETEGGKATATPKETEGGKATATPKATDSGKATAAPKVTATPKATAKPQATAMTDAEYKKKLKKDGFPDSYISALLALHKKFPQWEFAAYDTGLEWGEVISNENKLGLNLITNSKSVDWKSIEEGAYNWKTDAFIPFDGSTWVTASEKAVMYYMDPRNFLDERGIFQFESLEYQPDSHTQAGVENVLKNTPMYNTTFSYTDDNKKKRTVKYSQAFMEAATQSGVSPYHLASRVKQEVVMSATSMSSSVSGNVAGYKGIYNFYNIGANHSTVSGGAIANGLNWAGTGTTYLRPWNNRYKSIVGGASYIGKNYINVGQNTLYLQKFNVTEKNRYEHQYMGNIEAPNSEATKTNTAYGDEKKDTPLYFSIPVYKNMPKEACPVPSGGLNPNNYLKTLKVKDHAFTNKFTLGDDGSKVYKVTVGNSVESVKIQATAVSSLASVSGTGTKALSVGTKTFTVKVTSESGSVREYKIKITRSDS